MREVDSAVSEYECQSLQQGFAHRRTDSGTFPSLSWLLLSMHSVSALTLYLTSEHACGGVLDPTCNFDITKRAYHSLWPPT